MNSQLLSSCTHLNAPFLPLAPSLHLSVQAGWRACGSRRWKRSMRS